MPSSSETHGSRRVKYGLNVVIAIAAAVLIVIIINAIGYKRLFRVRLDMTATRRWSLSDHTTKVVKNLDGDYRIVLLMTSGSEYIEQARDLVAEYGYLSGSLKIEEINPLHEARSADFYDELFKRYEPQVAPVKQAIETGRAAMKTIENSIKEQLALLQPMIEAGVITDPKTSQSVGEIVQFYVQHEQLTGSSNAELDKMASQPLPDYNGALAEIKRVLTQEAQYAKLITDRLTQAGESKATPTGVKDALLRVVSLVKQSSDKVASQVAAVTAAQPAEGYGKVRSQVGVNTAVVLGPEGKQPRVIAIEEMFKVAAAPNAPQTEDKPEVRFLGEEKITGALVAMSMTHQPMVVFVSSGQQPALGRGGQYEKVAQRLRNMNFDVRDWSLTPQPNPMMGNQPMPPGPPPVPNKGQLAVWIVPPIQAQGNPFQQQPGGGDAQKVIEQLTERLSEGDAVMVMTSISQMSMFGMPDAMAQFVETWGVSAKTDRIIFNEMQTQNRRTQATPMVQVDQWPDGSPLSPAMAGLAAVFPQSVPLEVSSNTDAIVTPLAIASGESMFVFSDLQSQEPPKRTDENKVDSATVAVTVEQSGNRMMVVGNGMWATDQITTIDQVFRSPGLSPPYPAMFPGNTELFVNSVLWLAEMDDLIATSAASQDIRRIGEIKDGTMIALRWLLLAGMPLLTIAAGTCVWLVRRKG